MDTLIGCRSYTEHPTLSVHDWIGHDVPPSCNHHLGLLLRQRHEVLCLQSRSCILIPVSPRTKNMIVQFLVISSLLNRESCPNFGNSLIPYSQESWFSQCPCDSSVKERRPSPPVLCSSSLCSSIIRAPCVMNDESKLFSQYLRLFKRSKDCERREDDRLSGLFR